MLIQVKGNFFSEVVYTQWGEAHFDVAGIASLEVPVEEFSQVQQLFTILYPDDPIVEAPLPDEPPDDPIVEAPLPDEPPAQLEPPAQPEPPAPPVKGSKRK